MSKLIVKIRQVSEVSPHPNADKLDILKIDHWQTIYVKGVFEQGHKCVYFPPDTCIPFLVAEHLGITKYTTPTAKVNGEPTLMRVRAIRLRGEESFGLVIPMSQFYSAANKFSSGMVDSQVGTDVANIFSACKYDPPEPCRDGDAARPDPAFHKYTSIENIRNYGDILKDNEEVIFTEKIHGCNARVGKIKTINEDGEVIWEYMCGSHGVRRKEYDACGVRSQFWNILTPELKSLLDEICENKNNVVVFGELYGCGVQDMQYGLQDKKFRAFDISLNRKYLDFDEKIKLLNKHNIPTVPILYRGPFSWTILQEYTSGYTTLCNPEVAGKFKGREGVVINPVEERFDKSIGGDGRVIFKSISADYLARKGGTEFK